MCSEEVAIFFGPTANPVGVSTEGVLARPFRAELVLATLQRSVVEESALPHPGAKASASGETAPPALASGKLFSVAAAPPPVAPPHPEHGPSASGAAEPPLDAPARRAAPQFMTQNSTERRDAGLPAVSVARRPSNISLLDDDAPAGAMLEEDPDSVLLDGAGGVRDSHSDALGRGRPGGGREAPRSHSGTRAAPGGPSAVAVATARVPQAPPISLTQLPAAPPGESQEF